ncbi:hypothetical protein ACJ72_01686 [Emergomyces africanus]|uniref:Uncharacterized protein n=1 Tax=Emergomyces africanus TaxID=1955775 RepID=A0A1B7P4I8_9EURO|nr:hypothetical protein ACJ72_01686 [Emergomyces africanus]
MTAGGHYVPDLSVIAKNKRGWMKSESGGGSNRSSTLHNTPNRPSTSRKLLKDIHRQEVPVAP